jgi:DnaJ family protein B protein 4
MSLEDLYFGKTFYFRVVRYRRSGRKTIVPLEVHVAPGTPAGTEIVVEDAGNERKDGTMQAVVFVVKEVKHERFTRMQEDLLMEVRLPWVDSLNEESGRVYFQSIDGGEYIFNVDYHMNGLLSGTTVIPDAGMPTCDGHSRGRVVIRYVCYVWRIILLLTC